MVGGTVARPATTPEPGVTREVSHLWLDLPLVSRPHLGVQYLSAARRSLLHRRERAA